MIEQQFEFLADADKMRALNRLLEREMDGSRILVRAQLLPPRCGYRDCRVGHLRSHCSFAFSDSRALPSCASCVRMPTLQQACRLITLLLGRCTVFACGAAPLRKRWPAGGVSVLWLPGARRCSARPSAAATRSRGSCARTAGPRSPSTATRASRSATGCWRCAPPLSRSALLSSLATMEQRCDC